MAKSSLISIPALVLPSNALSTLLISPKKRPKKSSLWSMLSCWGILISVFACLSMLLFLLKWHPDCSNVPALTEDSSFITIAASAAATAPLPPHSLDSSLTDEEREFWRQPENEGYRPCLQFSSAYRQASQRVIQQRRNHLIVVVSGGLNQQRNQIVDAVVIARILEAVLVVPIMQVNVIWGDDSEFSDIFDVDHFKKSLKDDVRIVSSLPSTHLMSRPTEEKKTPINVTPEWLRSHYLKKLNRDGILLLRGLDSRLSKDLPSDLQKLRCKVAFDALRFSTPIQALGNQIAQRMWSKGPYLALHLRLEKDVWVRSGCSAGLGEQYDEEIKLQRKLNPNLLTARNNMTQEQRQLAGLCPLTAVEVVRLLKGLGASRRTRIYWAGGMPFGGMQALEALKKEYPNLYNKEDLASDEELKGFRKKASSMAAIDYLVSLNSDVFIPSHGGNMAHSLKGHRAYIGHRKHITPNKRELISYLLNTTMSEEEVNVKIKQVHRQSIGQPAMLMEKKGRDVVGYPVPECMSKV